VLIVYLLYFAAYIFGITALIGVIIAHVRFPDANLPLPSHYQFQIRTFWIGVLYLVVGTVLAFAITMLPITPNGPVPTSSRPISSAIETCGVPWSSPCVTRDLIGSGRW
jgi:hypothetical protein